MREPRIVKIKKKKSPFIPQLHVSKEIFKKKKKIVLFDRELIEAQGSISRFLFTCANREADLRVTDAAAGGPEIAALE